jgi:hypothetical protein
VSFPISRRFGNDAKLLMNHAIPEVDAGYIARPKLLEDHLRHQQHSISGAVFAA